MAMAGRAAECVVFGADMVTSGAESDIEQATRFATAMVTRWGFSEAVGLVRVPEGQAANDEVVRKEIRLVVSEAYDAALGLVTRNRGALDAVASALLDKESLGGDEVRRIVEKNAALVA